MSTAPQPLWTVTPEKIRAAVERLVTAAQPRKIILFGSRARDDARMDSDLDLLVIEAQVRDRVAEMVRLYRALRGLLLPVELLVIGEAEFATWSHTPGNVYYEALREGRILYESESPDSAVAA